MFDMRDHGGHFGGGGSGKVNVFSQLTEPNIKEGIWFQSPEVFKKIIDDDSVWGANRWNDDDEYQLSSIPAANACYFHSKQAIVNGELYVFYAIGTAGSLIKYNFEEDVWTVLATGGNKTVFPYNTLNTTGGIVTKGQYIYLVGEQSTSNAGSDYQKSIVRYDTVTNTSSIITTSTYTFSDHLFYMYKGKLYSKNKSITSESIQATEFDPETETLRTAFKTDDIYLASFSWRNNKSNQIEVEGDYLYYIDSAWNLCKVNIETSEATILIAMPTTLQVSFTMRILNGYLYFLKDDTSTVSTPGKYFEFIRYNIYENVFETLDSIYDAKADTYRFGNIRMLEYYEGSFYALRGSNMGYTEPIKLNRFSFTSKQYDQNTAIIIRADSESGQYRTELLNRDQILKGPRKKRMVERFDDAYLYVDGDIDYRIPTYYGDGTKWVKFKN